MLISLLEALQKIHWVRHDLESFLCAAARADVNTAKWEKDEPSVAFDTETQGGRVTHACVRKH